MATRRAVPGRQAAALLLVAGLLAPPGAHPAANASCSAQSGRHTAALVELYTSEGCDSCPPADRWLSGLAARGYAPDRVVPLSLHVDYWDYIGWKDPYAKREFATRQRKHAQMKRARIVYTPQVLVQGEDFREWRSAPAFDAMVSRINAQPPRAALRLELPRGHSGGAASGHRDGHLEARLVATLAERGAAAEHAVFIAAYENKLSGRVTAGENRGRTLEHDYVVREWVGPLAFDASGRLEQALRLPMLPGADPRQSGVAAFVQGRSGGEVLQALMLPVCGG